MTPKQEKLSVVSEEQRAAEAEREKLKEELEQAREDEEERKEEMLALVVECRRLEANWRKGRKVRFKWSVAGASSGGITGALLTAAYLHSLCEPAEEAALYNPFAVFRALKNVASNPILAFTMPEVSQNANAALGVLVTTTAGSLGWLATKLREQVEEESEEEEDEERPKRITQGGKEGREKARGSRKSTWTPKARRTKMSLLSTPPTRMHRLLTPSPVSVDRTMRKKQEEEQATPQTDRKWRRSGTALSIHQGG